MNVVVRKLLEWAAYTRRVILGFIPRISGIFALPPKMLGINPSMTGLAAAQQCWTTSENLRGQRVPTSTKTQGIPSNDAQNVGPLIATGQQWQPGANSRRSFVQIVPREGRLMNKAQTCAHGQNSPFGQLNGRKNAINRIAIRGRARNNAARYYTQGQLSWQF